MAETGPVVFHGNYLDPSAQEFWPAQNGVFQPQFHLFRPSQLYYPYAAPPLTVSFAGGGMAQFHTADTHICSSTYTFADRVRYGFHDGFAPAATSSSKCGDDEGVDVGSMRCERVCDEGRIGGVRGNTRAGLDLDPGESDACTQLPRPQRGLISKGAVGAHFIIPSSNTFPDGNNQGTVVVFNLDPGVSSSELRDILQVYGPVKELRETPSKTHQKFVEFYDVRDAAKALREMNGKEINGKQVIIEFSRPGGYNRKFINSCTHNIPLTAGKYNRPPSPPPPPPPPFLAQRLSNGYSPNIPPRSFLSRSQSPTKKAINSSKGKPNENNKRRSSVGTPVAGGGGAKKTAKNQNNKLTQRSSNGIKPQCRGRLKKSLLNMLDNHCVNCNEQIVNTDDDQPLSSYDFVYLPVDFNNKCNVGYGFVNMTSPEATWRLYKAVHHQHWEVFNSRKICEVTNAGVQGLEALKEHFSNSKFPCETDHYLPVVFAPARDGKQLTEPVPIVGEKQQSINGENSSKSDEEQENDDDQHSDNGATIANHFNSVSQRANGGVVLEVAMASGRPWRSPWHPGDLCVFYKGIGRHAINMGRGNAWGRGCMGRGNAWGGNAWGRGWCIGRGKTFL
ncbi:Terminal EAR1-like 1, putative isoform 2 [Hibiscus syriacus]|uniref:Terminal EAR1-like 1, putative isoform 2 n=1 Tax=Hibiscus syriacus TaxID=106335 RepID=A0A6A2XHF9_HIBSY|nr:Terminal EAR1-like 1, putative isoform 2 [Hibiscus syriacus]